MTLQLFKIKFQLVLIFVIKVQCQDEELPEKPDNCHESPEFMYRQCCIFPPFFTREVAKECGAMFARVKEEKSFNITLMQRAAPADESHWKCVLERYKMLSAENFLEEEKYFGHLDKWAEMNPAFVNVVQDAKVNCKTAYAPFFPLEVKEFYNLHGCIRNYVNFNCPAVIPSPECDELTTFYERCRQFFVKK